MTAPHELSFREAVSVQVLGDDRFGGRYASWHGEPRVFGGLVLAQVMSAAGATVPQSLSAHSLKGCFLRPASPGDEVELVVERIRDGRSFTTRQIRTFVRGRETSRFVASFAGDELGASYQLGMPVVDEPVPAEVTGEEHPFELIELGSSPVDETGCFAWTRRAWLRCRAPLGDDPSTQTAAMAYASDLTNLAFYPGLEEVPASSIDASLDHALWIHHPSDLATWHLFELRCVAISGQRSTAQGLLFSADGVLRASMAQELLVRPQAP